MQLSGTQLRPRGFSENDHGVAAAGNREQRAGRAADAGSSAPARSGRPYTGFSAGPGWVRSETHASLKTLPWIFFLLGLLWYAVVWWALG